VALVVLVSSGAYALRTQSSPNPAVHGPLAAATAPVRTAGPQDATAVWDPANAFVFYQASQGKSVIAHTADGGQTWTAHQVPGTIPDDGERLAVGPMSAVVGDLITRDGGQTWVKAGVATVTTPGWPLKPPLGREITAVPDGWLVTTWDEAAMVPNRRPTVIVAAVDPATGVYHPLKAQPDALVADLGQIYRAGGKVLWGVSLQGQNLWAVHISTDAGASWSDVKVSSPNVGGASTRFATDGQTIYRTPGPVSTRAGGDGGNVPLAMRVSKDHGKTWSTPYAPAGVSDLNDMFVLGDGSLIATGRTPSGWAMVRSTDEGRTFRQVPGVPVSSDQAGLLPLAGGGYVYAVNGQTLVSADALHWKQVLAPR
jgi:hypothetical protein